MDERGSNCHSRRGRRATAVGLRDRILGVCSSYSRPRTRFLKFLKTSAHPERILHFIDTTFTNTSDPHDFVSNTVDFDSDTAQCFPFFTFHTKFN
jgi:hypothetical protein